MIEKLFAALIVAVCVVMLLRLVVGPSRRFRFDAAVRAAWRTGRRRALLVWNWRASRRHARHVADEAIRRARDGGVERDGNVYKPKSFRGPRKPH